MELTIDKEFAALGRVLTEGENELLEAGLLADGCRDPIVTWANNDDIIIDGHNRYRLCTKHELKFKTIALKLADRQAVMHWIAVNQLGRRNLNETQRAALAARLVTTSVGENQHGGSANLPTLPTTTAKAAEICNVSPRSVTNAKKVMDQGSEELQAAISDGTVAVSAAATIAELPKAQQKKLVKKGAKAVAAAAKEIKETKKYKDEFDTAKMEKNPPKNGREVVDFDDNAVAKSYGALVRLLDDRASVCGGSGGHAASCRHSLKLSYDSFLVWSGRKK